MSEWKDIKTVPVNEKSDYFFCYAMWGTEEDPTTGCAMRYKDEWFAGSIFYRGGRYDQRQYEFREHKINPTHWLPLPEPPNE